MEKKQADLRDRLLISEEERKTIEALLLRGTYEKEYDYGPIKVIIKEPKKESFWLAFEKLKGLLSENDNETTFIEKKNDILLAAYLKSFIITCGEEVKNEDFSERFDDIDSKLGTIRDLPRPTTDILVRALVSFQKLIESATSSEKLANF